MTMRPMVSRLALPVLLGVLAALWLPAPAAAHADLAGSAPADGTVLDRAPEVLVLSFTESVELEATQVTIVDGDGRHWAMTGLALRPSGSTAVGRSGGAESGAAGSAGAASDDLVAADTESAVEVVAALPSLPANTYRVVWRTLSSDDLHPTAGTLVFGVRREVGTAAAIPGPDGPGIRESVLRGIGLVGLATLFGAAALAVLDAMLIRRRDGDPADGLALRRRLLWVGMLGGCVALVATPFQLLVQVSVDPGHWRDLFVHQALRGRWLMREVGTGVLTAVLAVAIGRLGRLTRPGRRAMTLVGGLGSILAATGTALLGHPAGTSVAAAVGVVHVLAAGAWAGGVLAAALALMPDLRERPGRPEQVTAVLRSFGVLAVICVAALAATGLLLTAGQVSTVDGLLTTPYGLILLTKVALVGLAGLFGLRLAMRLRRGDGPRGGRGLRGEATALVLVLLLAGTLAAAGPARGPRFPVGDTAASTPQVSGQVADLIDTVTIRPNRPGRNIVTIVVSDTRRPAPALLTGVTFSLSGPDGTRKVHPVARAAEGWTVTVDDIRTAGNWNIAVTVMRDGLSPVTSVHAWAVPLAEPASVVVSSTPLQPWLSVLAGVVGVATLVVGVVTFTGRRRRRATAAGNRDQVAP